MEKKLSFNNFVHGAIDDTSEVKLAGSYFYEEDTRYYMLSLECCAELIKQSDESVNYCPHTVVYNHPSIVLDNELMFVEGNNIEKLQTKCDSTTVSQIRPQDLIKLSTCEISVTDQVGTYSMKGIGLLDVQVKLNEVLKSEKALDHRDLILYVALAISGILTILLFVLSILICNRRAREGCLSCCMGCKNQSRYLAPLGQMPPDGAARDYELRALHIRPYVSSMK